MPPLHIATRPLCGAPAVTLAGELDIAGVLEAEQAVDAAIRDSRGALVLDLSDLDFLDSSGIRVVLRARALLARDERDLAIVCPAGAVRRAFEVAGIDDLLALFPTRTAAVAALVPRG